MVLNSLELRKFEKLFKWKLLGKFFLSEWLIFWNYPSYFTSQSSSTLSPTSQQLHNGSEMSRALYILSEGNKTEQTHSQADLHWEGTGSLREWPRWAARMGAGERDRVRRSWSPLESRVRGRKEQYHHLRIETQIKENKKATASEKNLRAGGERETEMRLEVMRSSFITRVKGRETYVTSLVVQRLGFRTVTAVTQVQSLLRELKSCKLHSTAPPSPQKRKGGQRPRVQPRKQVLLQRPNKDKKRQFTPGPALKRREALITHSHNQSSTAVYNSLV